MFVPWTQRKSIGTCTPSSSAPASAASAWPSSSSRPARPTSWSPSAGHDVGGTWRDNTYPGAACDVPSQLYSFSFAPNRRLDPLLLPPAGDPGLHPARRRGVRRARPVRVRHRGRGGALGRRGRPLAHPYDAPGRLERLHRRRPGVRGRRALRPEAARHRRHRLVPGRDLPLRAVGPRLRPDRQARRRHRHRRLRDPDRPRDRQAGRAPRRLPAHRALRHPAQDRAYTAAGEARVQARPGLPADVPHRRSTSPARCSCRRFVVDPRLAMPAKRAALANIKQGHQRPRAAREGDPDLRDRLQAHLDLQRLVSQRSPGTTSTS